MGRGAQQGNPAREATSRKCQAAANKRAATAAANKKARQDKLDAEATADKKRDQSYEDELRSLEIQKQNWRWRKKKPALSAKTNLSIRN